MNLHNIFIEPNVTIQALGKGEYTDNTTILVSVTGLICEGICENRVSAALNKINSTKSVSHKKGSGDFIVQISESEVIYEQIKCSVLSQVIGMPIRRFLARLGTLFVID